MKRWFHYYLIGLGIVFLIFTILATIFGIYIGFLELWHYFATR